MLFLKKKHKQTNVSTYWKCTCAVQTIFFEAHSRSYCWKDNRLPSKELAHRVIIGWTSTKRVCLIGLVIYLTMLLMWLHTFTNMWLKLISKLLGFSRNYYSCTYFQICWRISRVERNAVTLSGFLNRSTSLRIYLYLGFIAHIHNLSFLPKIKFGGNNLFHEAKVRKRHDVLLLR